MRALLAAITLAIPTLAQAALPVGALAPDFTTPGAIGGKQFSFSLANALKKRTRRPVFLPRCLHLGLHDRSPAICRGQR